MRIYFSSNETEYAWLLNGFTVETDEMSYYFDLLGDTDYDPNGLNGRFKGNAYIEKDSEFEILTASSEEMLEKMLNDENSTVILNLYSTFDETEKGQLRKDFDKLENIKVEIEVKDKNYTPKKIKIECFDF